MGNGELKLPESKGFEHCSRPQDDSSHMDTNIVETDSAMIYRMPEINSSLNPNSENLNP